MMILAGIACATTALAQTSVGSVVPRSGGAVPDGGTIKVKLDTHFHPSSLIALIQRSRLIVDGTVTDRMPAIAIPITGTSMPHIETHSIVEVAAVLMGSVPDSSQDILIAQFGGISGKWNLEAEGDPLMSPGERYILFLIPDDRNEPPNMSGMARYITRGIWSGRLKVTNGTVAFPKAASAGLHTYDGTEVDAFLQTLRETIAHPVSGAGKGPLPFPPPQK